MIVLAQRIYRIGLQRLLTDGSKYYMEITNRTYHSIVEIPAEKVESWLRELNGTNSNL